jgi:hypothetical protein
MSKCVDGEVLSDTEATHRLNIKSAELTRQNAIAVASTQAAANAATIAYHRTVIASAKVAGSNAGLEPSLNALRTLTGGYT